MGRADRRGSLGRFMTVTGMETPYRALECINGRLVISMKAIGSRIGNMDMVSSLGIMGRNT